MFKIASAEQILGVPRLAPLDGPLGLIKNAHRHEFNYQPRHGYLYVRSRMISSRCNDNFDHFPAEEIKKGFHTFIGKPVFVNHHNDDHHRARGVIIDAALHEDRNPDGSPDTWVEGLKEIDALTFPMLAKAIVLGEIDRTSMGVDVDFSVCSACNNRATTPLEYCAHVPGQKGMKKRTIGANGQQQLQLIYESCYGLRFFEDSVLVEEPADPTAFFLGSVQAGPGLEHLTAGLSRTASMGDLNVSKPEALKSAMEGVSLGKDDDGYFVYTHRARSDSYPAPEKISQNRISEIAATGSRKFAALTRETPEMSLANFAGIVAAMQCTGCRSRNTLADLQGNAECIPCGHTWHEGTLQAELRAEAAKYDNPDDHPWFQKNPIHHTNIVSHWNDATPDEKYQGKRWYGDAHLVAGAIAKLAPTQPDKKQEAIDHHHRMADWQGRKDEHDRKNPGVPFPEKEPHTDARHPHGDLHLGAGALAIYSPQQGWAGNMHNAARVLKNGKGLGGPGSGMFASASQKNSADRLLKGESYNDILAGPKIRDFAHLIEHGGDKEPENPHVVIDRHALGVAAGKSLSNDDYGSAPLAGARRKDGSLNRRMYDHVVGKYHEAAAHISKAEGEPIAGHQVQAVTWLVRQRKNQENERAKAAGGADSRLDKGREKSRLNAEQNWNDFRQQHMPDSHVGPGTGYQASRRIAYGETKAPADVDTLRDESCSVCGEQDAWRGGICAVCGYVAPPKAFQDPDLDMAKQMDMRKQQDSFDESMAPATGADGLPIEGDEQPMLTCDVCGYEAPAGEPMTTETDDPQAGDDPEMQADPEEAMEEEAEGAGPAEGDVCPNCGKGVLESGTELAAEGEMPPPGEEEEPGEEDIDPEDPDALSEEDEDPEEEDGPVDPRDLPEDPDDEEDDDDEEDTPPAKGKGNPFKK